MAKNLLLEYSEELATVFYRFKSKERSDYTPFLAQFISACHSSGMEMN